MKNAIIFIIALAVSSLVVAESSAQNYGKFSAPLGLEWGLSAEQLAEMGVELTPIAPLDAVGVDVYTATNLPKKLSDAERYVLTFKPGFGLVKADVTTYPITRDVDVVKGKERYRQLKTAMVKKYGKPDYEYEWLFDHITLHHYECMEINYGCGQWGGTVGK